MLVKPKRLPVSVVRVWRVAEMALASPVGLAASFAILATFSSVAVAHFEGRLTTIQHGVTATGASVAIVPFIGNLSTLVDFVLLNPVVIYFLQRSRRQRNLVDSKLGVTRTLPLYHRAGLALLCAVMGVYAMKFYVEGSQFFDATLIPDAGGHSRITATGWVVYSWTALYIAWLLFAMIEHGVHVARILNLRPIDIPYSPYHPDNGGGVRFLMEPSLSAGYAMIGLLATFVIFVIHDRLLYHIESNRLFGFVLYVAVALPMFSLPFCKLHQLMKVRRDEYLLSSLDETLSAVRGASERADWGALAGCVATMESAEKYRKIVCSFPVWPIPMALALPSLGSVGGAIVPIVQKLISSSMTGLPLPGV